MRRRTRRPDQRTRNARKQRLDLIPVSEDRLTQLRQFLDPVIAQVEEPGYIASDPVTFMHLFDGTEDRNLVGFLAALLAWGRRDIVIAKVGNLLERFGTGPADYIGNLTDRDERRLEGFRHRTFTADDICWLLRALSRILSRYGSFEQFWADCYGHLKKSPENDTDRARLLIRFHEQFFGMIPEAPQRVRKHLATPVKNSSCKRIWLYLRWTLRQGSCVDPGTMSFMPPSRLMIPLDVHVARYARMFGLITRRANDWKAVSELTAHLRRMDASDPAKYDYALFGLGIRDIPVPSEFVINAQV